MASHAGTPKAAWPTFSLQEITAYDPFAIAKAGEAASSSNPTTPVPGDTRTAAQAAAGDAKAGSTESESAFTGRIHAVYQRGGRTAALVGSKTIRPGDQLEGAGRVVEVDQDGVMLELHK